MPVALPPLETLHRALREITETFAGELASPRDNAPCWSPWEWTLARAVAALHGVSPLLAGSLRWHDSPEDWRVFLQTQRRHTADRFTRMQELLSAIDSRARETGIAAVALKGAELHARKLYVGGDRPMADLDLLVPTQEFSPMARLLAHEGFRETLRTTRHVVFEPEGHSTPADFGEHAANHIKIELHTAISERLPLDPVDITDVILPPCRRPGLNSYDSPAALLTHLLHHCAGAMTGRCVRLIQLQDIARVAARMSEADWAELLDTALPRSGGGWWALPPLQLADRYFSCVPPHVLERSEQWCPRRLARRSKGWKVTDQSYSYLWIDAFPAMDWATSLPARARYALRRIFPERELRATRAVLQRSEPRNWQSDWAGLSQSRRILRWLTSRPTRVETLSAVRAALGQSQRRYP